MMSILILIFTMTLVSISCFPGNYYGYSHPKLLSQSVHLDEIPTKIIKVTKTVAVKIPVPYIVRIPVHIPLQVDHPVAIPVPKIVKIDHHIPFEVTKQVPVELHQQVPLVTTKTVSLPHPVSVPHIINVDRPVPLPVPYQIPTFNHDERYESESNVEQHKTDQGNDGNESESSHDVSEEH